MVRHHVQVRHRVHVESNREPVQVHIRYPLHDTEIHIGVNNLHGGKATDGNDDREDCQERCFGVKKVVHGWGGGGSCFKKKVELMRNNVVQRLHIRLRQEHATDIFFATII